MPNVSTTVTALFASTEKLLPLISHTIFYITIYCIAYPSTPTRRCSEKKGCCVLTHITTTTTTNNQQFLSTASKNKTCLDETALSPPPPSAVDPISISPAPVDTSNT